jgi:glutaredoxin
MTKNFIKTVALISCFCVLLGGFGHQAPAKAAKNKPTKASNQATSSSANSQTIAYAQCLKESGITMYGTSWCTHCQHQKQIFGELFSYVNFVDCDKESELCDAKGIKGYPTWVLPNGKEVNPGSIESIAKASGCGTPATATAEKKEDNKPSTTSGAREFYAKCLQEKGVKMYGLSHCPHCKAQKKEFGDLFKYVSYVECDSPTERCKEASKKGKGYPTWLTPDGSKIEPGSVEEVALDAGCKYNPNATASTSNPEKANTSSEETNSSKAAPKEVKPTPAKNASKEASTQDLLKDLDNVQSPYSKKK